MKIRVAKLTKGDFKAFYEMHVLFRYAEYNPADELEREPVIKDYDDFMEYVQKEWIYFAVQDGEVIGYAIITAFEDMSVKIEELYVSRKHQREGYGKKFVKKFIEFLKENDMKRVEVFSATIATDNFWSECNFRSVNGTEMYEYKIK